MRSDIEIAQAIPLRPIGELAADIGLEPDDLIPYGRYVAKIPAAVLDRFREQPEGRLVLVTAMTPPPKGAGKTTTTIGLAQALTRLGRRAVVAIREPSLGPCMGMKGGAAGGGYAQVLPMEEINLHFTGDLHAVTMAHNLCAAVVDNHLHQRAEPAIDARRVVWKRVIDMNDRTLRNTLVGLMDKGLNGVLREDGFEITAASEIMAILCLADGIADLKRRIGQVIVGYNPLRQPVTAGEIGIPGAMAALLKHALQPNLVQTTEGTPALVHGGPFANIAHGCNTLTATRLAMKLGDYAITEAGFGADLGAEKFFNIKCRAGDLRPSAAVVVVPKTAFDLHGLDNLRRHVESIRSFGVPVVVAINRYAGDELTALDEIQQACRDAGIEAEVADYREGGGEGGLALADAVDAACRGEPPALRHTYPLEMPLADKVEAVASRVYGADGVEYTAAGKRALVTIENLGYGSLPICMAKTPMSLTDNPKISGCPSGFTITVTDAKLSAGAGFVVVYTGSIMTMPGLPKHPAALNIDIDDDGTISGLF